MLSLHSNINKKGLIIDLTQSEKRTFIRFFALYLGGSFILMFFIAYLYYENQTKLYFDLTKTKMQKEVSSITAQITFAHMSNNKIDLNKFLLSDKYKIAFYDKNKKMILGNFDDNIDFTKKIIQHEKHFILIDDSTHGHNGVYFIAIEENLFYNLKQKLKIDITYLFLFIYFIISLIGFYLAKLFLKPIREEYEKLDNFIKDTTHELNTPISAILMSINGDTLTAKQTQRVKLSARKISEIYKDLTYIFLEDTSDKSFIKKHNLKELILEQLEYFMVLAEKKNINIIIDLEDIIYEVDKNDFTRLFNNIVSNAIKYNNPKGSISITLKENFLIVKDTGIGIEKNKIQNIYNRYYRATTQSGGFGVGLNIVRNVCRKYDIKFEVESKIKEGTQFKFSL